MDERAMAGSADPINGPCPESREDAEVDAKGPTGSEPGR